MTSDGKKRKLGIYIHIPFCLKKCNYCDFCSYPGTDEETRERYIDALCRHISQWRDRAVGCETDTVYFGGGTPTLLTAAQFGKIFSSLNENFAIAANAEITVECNPKTADADALRALRAFGVNRLSVGMQSASDSELRALGRLHDFFGFLSAYDDARRAGFDNIGVDVMLAIPEQTRESLRRTLELLVALEPEHISAYSLIIEPGTPFFDNREKLVFPDEDEAYTMYADALSFLSEKNYMRYEISNFSRPGRESRHNLKYWLREEYLGFGASAHSFFGERRFFAPSELSAYIGGEFCGGDQPVTRNDAVGEYVMLRMRLSRGVEENVFAERFGVDFESMFGDKLKKYCDGGFVVRQGGRCAFTDSGFCVSSSILSDILTFDT